MLVFILTSGDRAHNHAAFTTKHCPLYQPWLKKNVLKITTCLQASFETDCQIECSLERENKTIQESILYKQIKVNI